MSEAVGVSVLAQSKVLVAMHDLDSPVVAIDFQQPCWRCILGIEARDEPCRFGCLVPLPFAPGLTNAPYAAELRDIWPGVIDIGSRGGQDVDLPDLDPPVPLLNGLVTAEGEKPAR